jgi:hypothetical protein
VNTCQISVVKNETSEKNSSSGTARTSTATEAPSRANSRTTTHHTMKTSPNPTTT